MDHLPAHDDNFRIPVPCLSTIKYDGGTFISYGLRVGWDTLKLFNGDLEGKTVVQAAAFLQKWIYFGLLHAIFGPTNDGMNDEDFVEEVDGVRLITTKKLPAYILSWRSWEQGRTKEEKDVRFQYVKECLDRAAGLARRFCQPSIEQQRLNPTRWPLTPEICLSINILGDTLVKAGFQILDRPFNIDWGASDLLKVRMRDAGWCPRAIATLCKGQQIHNLWYASTLGQSQSSQSHVNCNEKLCAWEQVDESTYETRHRTPCSECSYLGPDANYLIQAIEDEDTPLVAYSKRSDQSHVTLSSTKVKAEYIAISHVWGDGLGNANTNQLPACQMGYLQSIVDGLYPATHENPGPRFWWCDTLCIPVLHEHREYRKLAIRKMKQIYQDATKVVALDATLLSISKDAYIVELYVRLKMSSWARRLWTLQEAVLAQDVHIQFADGTRTLRDLTSSIMQEGLRDDQYLYTRYSRLASTFFSPFVQSNKQNREQRFTSLWKQLQWRATSHAEDEPVCLAATLGIDPGPIINIPPWQPQARTAKLYELQKAIPFVVLIQPPPRLEIDGYRWAPTSLLNCFRQQASNPFRVLPGVGQIHPDGRGLLFTRPGFLVNTTADKPLPLTGDDFPITDATNQIQLLVIYDRFETDAVTADFGKRVDSPAIIFLDEEARLGRPAVLADVVDKEWVVKKAKFIAMVWLGPGPKRDLLSAEQGTDAFPVSERPTQHWHLM